jgi:hypothetical protein
VSELNQPLCRLCGHLLKAKQGCDTCLPCKRNVQWPVLRDDLDTVATAKALTQDTAKMLRRQLRRLKSAEKSQGDSYNPEITTQMVKLARPIKELAGEVRKLEDRDDDRYAALTYEEKCKLYLEHFFMNLPEENQVRLLTEMQRTFENQRQSLLLPEAEIIPDE